MPTWLAALSAVLVALVALSALVLVVRGAWHEGKIAELRADNDDLRKRDEDRVRQIAELEAREANLEGRVRDLERDKKTLVETVTQAAKTEVLITEFQIHRKAVQQRQGEIISKIDQALVMLAAAP